MADKIFSYEFGIVTDAAQKAIDDLNKSLAESGRKSVSHSKQMQAISDAIDDATNSVTENKEAAKKYGEKIKELAELAKSLAAKEKLLAEALDRTATNMRRGTAEAKAIDNQVKRASTEKQTRDLERQARALEKLNEQRRIQTEQQRRANRLHDLAGGTRETRPFPYVGLDPEETRVAQEAAAKKAEATKKAADDKALAEERKRQDEYLAYLVKFYIQQQKLLDKALADEAKKKRKQEKKAEKEAAATLKKETAALDAEIKRRKKLVQDYLNFKDRGGDPNKLTGAQGAAFGQARDDISGQSTDAAGKAAAKFAAEYQASLERGRKIQQEMNEEMGRTGQALDKNTKKVEEYGLSWQSIGRIIVARAVTQAFFQIQAGLAGSVREAAELYRVVAEIQTITSQSQRSDAFLSADLERVITLSSKLNFTPDDVGLALYEALSNQIGETTGQLVDFIEVSGALAKVTRSTLASSSDAIAATINAYNLSIDDAQSVSEKFFTLVDRGRLHLEDVANNIGNVAVPASQLGVSFNEVVGGLSAISIAGVPPKESMTLLRNIMFKLIDPTDKMVELFNEWGVGSGQAAIATYGFSGIIERLSEVAAQGNEEIAELFGTIRAVRGVLGLTGENLKKYEDAVASIAETQRTYNETVQAYIDSPGETFSRIIQQTSNEFLNIGVNVVKTVDTLNDLIQSVFGVENAFSSSLGVLLKLVVGLGTFYATLAIVSTTLIGLNGAVDVVTAAFVRLAAAETVAAEATGVLGAALGFLELHPVIAGLSAIAAALVAGTALWASFGSAGQREIAALVASSQELTKGFSKGFVKSLRDSIEEVSSLYDEKLKKTLQNVAEEVQNLNKEAANLEEVGTIDKLSDQYKRLLDILSGDEVAQKLAIGLGDAVGQEDKFQGTVDTTNKMLEDRLGIIDKTLSKLRDQKKVSEDLLYNSELQAKISSTDRNLSRFGGNRLANEQYNVATDIANKAANTSDIEESRKLFDLARKYLSQAEQTAFQSGTFGTLDRHIAYFNQQDQALFEAQKRREQQFQASQIEERGIRQQTEKESIQAELDRRAALENTIKLELAFLEEYQKRAKDIRKDTTLSLEEKTARQVALDDSFRGNLTTPEGKAAFENEARANAIRLQVDELKRSAEDARRSSDELRAAQQAQIQSLSNLGSAIDSASGALLALAQDVKENFPVLRSSFRALLTPEQVEDRRKNQAIANELPGVILGIQEKLRRGEITPEKAVDDLNVVKILLDSLSKQFGLGIELNGVYDLAATLEKVIVQLEQSQASNDSLTQNLQKATESLDNFGPKANAASSEGEQIDPAFGTDFAKRAEYDGRNLNAAIPLEPNDPFAISIAENLVQSIEGAVAKEAEKRQPLINGQPLQQDFFKGPLINGVPKEFYNGVKTGQPLINGQPAEYTLGPKPAGPLINGQPADQAIGESVNSASWASIPPAMEEGAQAVYKAIEEGSNRIPEKIVAGITEAFRQNQIVNPAANTAAFRNDQRRYAYGGSVDSIPALLSPGEFVVRASQARRNINLLQAINAGSYRRYAGGGSVSNSQTFQNNFNITSSNPQMQTANIVSAIRRQIQQGKASFSKGRPY